MTAQRRIFLQLRTAFGKDRIYPVCAYSLDLTALTGRPTLLPQDLAVIQRLGFEVCWIPATESDPLQCLAEMEKV